MSEEFHESDVLFSDHFEGDSFFRYRKSCLSRSHRPAHPSPDTSDGNSRNSGSADGRSKSESSPIDIPENSIRGCAGRDEVLDEGFDGGEIVPPHLIVARRNAGSVKMTLKGRDLDRVRNSILRMTGFLEV